MKTLGFAVCVCSLAALSPAFAGEAVLTFKVPKSAYAFVPSPECAGWRQDVHNMMRDEEFISGVSSVNPVAGAVVATIGFYDSVSATHGGEISKMIRKLHGGSYSQCLSATYMVPEDVTTGYIEFSDRNGGSKKRLPLQAGYWSRVEASDDWSNWREVEVTQAGGRIFVSATAANWRHDVGSNQTMTVHWITANAQTNNLNLAFELVGKEPPPLPPQSNEYEEPKGGLHKK